MQLVNKTFQADSEAAGRLARLQGETISAALQKGGGTQKQLASALGISRSNLSRVVVGDYLASEPLLLEMERILEITIPRTVAEGSPFSETEERLALVHRIIRDLKADEQAIVLDMIEGFCLMRALNGSR